MPSCICDYMFSVGKESLAETLVRAGQAGLCIFGNPYNRGVLGGSPGWVSG